MLKVKINGKTYDAEKGEFILDVCRRNRILVPTLCHHDGIAGLGACRLCVVEVKEGKNIQVVVSCIYPLDRDCEVFTESETIKKIRKTILSMLKTRAPSGDRLASLCQIYGVEETKRFTPPNAVKGSSGKSRKTPGTAEKQLSSSCVLCGLCVKACSSLGTGAISTAERGVTKKISTPYGEPSADCIGCGSCASVCPTKAIECTESGGQRTIWGRKFKLIRCYSCDTAFATKEEYFRALEKADLEYRDARAVAPDHAPLPEDILCDVCRKKKSAGVFAAAFGERV